MQNEQTILERAFDLAKSGKFARVTELKKQLRGEGHSTDQIAGPELYKQLTALMKAASIKNA
jgi:hypothetical protein